MKSHLSFFFIVAFLFLSTLMKAQVALAFNGVNNYVSTSGSPVLNNQSRTVDAWIKTTSTVTTQNVICDWGNLTPNGSRFTMNMINSKLRIEVGGVGMTGTTNINTGQWVHCTAVYESTITSGPNVFLYLNGTLEATGTFTGYPTLTTTTTVGFRIGARVDGINFFGGAIDEVKVFNYARSQAQIAADTIQYCSTQTGLVAYYKLNEGIANATNTGSTTAIDYSGLGNNGTLNSFTLSGINSNWVPGRISNGAPSISVSPGLSICSGNSISLSTNAVNNFTWSNGISTSTIITVSPSSTSTYSILSINSLSCSNTTTISVTVNTAAPTVTVVALQNPICTGAATSFSATGASSYSWSGSIVNGQLFTPSTTTTYSLIASNGCGSVNSIHTITVSPLPVSVTANTTTVCQGNTCTLTALTSAIGYTWMPGSQTGSNIMVSPNSNTNYTVSISNGTCIGSQTIQINTLNSPSITISNSVAFICEGMSTSFAANGSGNNGSYTWSPGGINTSSITVSPSVSMIYTVSGTNSIGCSASAQIPVVVLSVPLLTLTTSNTLICNGSTATISASGAGTYTWSTGAIGSSTVVSPTSNLTVYSVIATSASNSCTSNGTIGIAVLTPSINYSNTLSICRGSNATLTATGANNYSWNNIPVGSSGTLVITPSSTSSYTLIATTQSININCLSTHLATVIVNPNPTVTAVASNSAAICRGNSSTITANGANSYSWSGITSTSTIVVVSPTITSIYTITGSSNSGCTSTVQVQVLVNACLDVAKNNESTKFIIYPNPIKTGFFIESTEMMTIQLFNLTGELIKTIEIVSGQNWIDTNALNTGIYFVKTKDANNIINQKIVIQ